jgi:hypothetical protein
MAFQVLMSVLGSFITVRKNLCTPEKKNEKGEKVLRSFGLKWFEMV